MILRAVVFGDIEDDLIDVAPVPHKEAELASLHASAAGYFLRPACQLVTMVIGGAVDASPSTSTNARNRWPSGDG